MTRQELEHAIRAAAEVAQDDELYIFGSQAILGQFPNAPAELRQSVEVDVAPRTRVDRVDHIDGSLGEESTFHRTFGFYVHGLPIEAARLPAGWQGRVIPVRDDLATNGKTGSFVCQIFDMMLRADWHAYQVLTKRPARAAAPRLAPPCSGTTAPPQSAPPLAARKTWRRFLASPTR